MSRVGGGVLALVSNHFHSYQIHVPKCFNRCEVECFELVTDLSTFRIIVLYRPPDFNALSREYIKGLYDCLCFCVILIILSLLLVT